MDNINETLKNFLLRSRLESPKDESFLCAVEELANQNGPEIYRAGLNILAGITLSPQDAKDHWSNFLKHREHLSKTLARDVDMTTALCDYLRQQKNLINHPRIIETVQYETVFYNTIHDRLTGLFNRRYFDEIFAQQLAQAKRYNDNLSVLFIDIDNFKDINDNYGHAFGDEVLRNVSSIINSKKRDSDIAARYGGEEFVLLMTRTDAESALIVAERLRLQIATTPVANKDQNVYVTISGGIASCPLHSLNVADLLEMADNALYQAKGAGKNRIVPFSVEKRRYLRVEFKQKILAKELDFQNSRPHFCESKDICVGGMLFENHEPFPLGALLTVKIHLDNGPPVLLIGNVVRVAERSHQKFDIGMTTSFKTMDKIAQQRIAGLLRHSSIM